MGVRENGREREETARREREERGAREEVESREELRKEPQEKERRRDVEGAVIRAEGYGGKREGAKYAGHIGTFESERGE